MSDTLVKIPFTSLVKQHKASNFSLNTKKWFKKETCTINFGEYTGAFGVVGAIRASVLNPLFAQGWYVVWVSGGGTSGATRGNKVTTRTETHSGEDIVGEVGSDTTNGTTVADGKATNESESWSNSNSRFDSSSESTSTARLDEKTNTSQVDSGGESKGSSHNSGWGKADAEASSHSEDVQQDVHTDRDKTTTTTHGHVVEIRTEETPGDPYYCSSATVKLERYILNNQTAVDELAKSFVSAHNAGQKINVDRYEELVGLYSTVVSRTEDEMNNIRPIAPEALRDIIDGVVRGCKNALDLFRDKVGEIPDTFGNSRIEEINRKFTKLLEETRSHLITQGLYNGTVWPTTESGIRRDWQIALNDLMDELVQLRIDAYGKIATLTCDIGGKVIDVLGKFREIVDMFIKLTEVRNDIFVKMCTFMEKREDTYPGAETIGAGVSKLALQTGAAY